MVGNTISNLLNEIKSSFAKDTHFHDCLTASQESLIKLFQTLPRTFETQDKFIWPFWATNTTLKL